MPSTFSENRIFTPVHHEDERIINRKLIEYTNKFKFYVQMEEQTVHVIKWLIIQ